VYRIGRRKVGLAAGEAIVLEDVRDQVGRLVVRQPGTVRSAWRHGVANLDEERRERLHPELVREQVAGQRWR